MHHQLTKFIRDIYQTNDFIPLHSPTFQGNEKAYVLDTLESTFVSSVGKYVDRFEDDIARYTGAKKAIATVNGSAALHASLYLAGIKEHDLVLTQSLTFVATCNSIYQLGAQAIFIDISLDTLSLCPDATAQYLEQHAELDCDGQCRHKLSKQNIKAILPMHTFGHPAKLEQLQRICEKWNLILIEDAAESLGSFYQGQHTGTFGKFSAISFNGNKIITTGGGGMILCDDLSAGEHAKHITTTAKVAHPYEYFHDQLGFNYRLPNLNAALGCAQMESLQQVLENKRALAARYQTYFNHSDLTFVVEPKQAHSNYWLNAIICPNEKVRDNLLIKTNEQGVMTRPIWKLMHRLPMFSNALKGKMDNSEYIEKHLINLPSSPYEIS
ncbi:aminotransferase DegT [Psychromonas sp. psych-6C06]|uniref:LegC family aminotransferase n=1 Tax=Psychromonas sp. psych-6C06 TaxID=2058089 RepID=UPI000C33BEF5|nr:LegC family aminotransferase [Psychromonas sp. psych-6C06]PKF62894.1 aminotransferase DegT [Psychromonas sp. psych-6C06]